MTIRGIFNALTKHEFCYKVSKKVFRYFEQRRTPSQSFASNYIFDDRQNGSKNLLIVLLGFQPYYWEVVLDRVRRNVDQFSEPIDVCLCVPCGANGDQGGVIREFARRHEFSYLFIHLDLLAQAQNTAIKLHPNAKWIFKIDEDIILSDNYFARMKSAYEKADKELPYKVGFLGPLINLNAVCTPYFLKALNLETAYEKEFGKYRVENVETFMTADIHANEETARFIWKNSIPFDEVAAKVANSSDIIIMAPIRFSIGAILCTREYWERIGYFDLSPIGSGAAEEVQMNIFCQMQMLSIAIATNILVGHLGFFPQKEACRKFFEEYIDKIKHM